MYMLEFIIKYSHWIILILGIILLGIMYKNYWTLVLQKGRINELLERRNKKYIKNKDTRKLEEEDDDDSSVSPDTIRSHEKDFNNACSLHNMYAQLIPIFPLMGVLGTVVGLIKNVSATETAQMLDSLDIALYTTAAGLICAIVLKVFDVFCPSKVINDVEVMLEDFNKKLDLSNMF